MSFHQSSLTINVSVKQRVVMQAIILAGGLGTRLQSIVPDLPKPMAAVGNEPFLAILLRYMAIQGVREVVFALHHQAQVIRAYFGHQFAGMNIAYSIETTPLGTGGAIQRALPLLSKNAPVFVANGDSLVMLNYQEMLKRHIRSKAPITLATVPMPITTRYSKLTVQKDHITQYAVLGDEHPGIISTGFYIMQPTLFTPYTMPESFSIERDFLAQYTQQLKPGAFEHVEYFIDIGIPADYRRAQTEVPKRLQRAA